MSPWKWQDCSFNKEVDVNPFDEIKDKSKGDIVTCSVLETGDYGVKVRMGDKEPITVIKKSELALRKTDADQIVGLAMIN